MTPTQGTEKKKNSQFRHYPQTQFAGAYFLSPTRTGIEPFHEIGGVRDCVKKDCADVMIVHRLLNLNLCVCRRELCYFYFFLERDTLRRFSCILLSIT